MRETWVQPLVRKIPWRKEWQLIPVFLPGKLHGQRSLMGYSPGGHKELDTTEQLPLTHTGHIQLLRQPSGLLPLLFSLYLSVTVILFLFHDNLLFITPMDYYRKWNPRQWLFTNTLGPRFPPPGVIITLSHHL